MQVVDRVGSDFTTAAVLMDGVNAATIARLEHRIMDRVANDARGDSTDDDAAAPGVVHQVMRDQRVASERRAPRRNRRRYTQHHE